MEYNTQQMANLSGVSARTLRYYDQMGLLCPQRTCANGYRVYGPREVDRLQQILFYRELGIKLQKIREMLQRPDMDRAAALTEHYRQLCKKREQLDRLIQTLQTTIMAEKGEIIMTDEQKFEGLKKRAVEENRRQHGEEARGRYGEEAVNAADAKLLGQTRREYDRMGQLEQEIRARLEEAVKEGARPEGQKGAVIAELHRQWLQFTWTQYSPEAHAGLARMYVEDPRFTAYYDRTVPGCAAFLRDAVLAFCAGRSRA